MKQKSNHQSIILLVEECSKDKRQIQHWLDSHNFSARETTNVYDALDEISDFTVEQCPDVFMLPVSSLITDFATIEELVETYSETGDILIATFSDADGISARQDVVSRQFFNTKTNVNALPSLKNAVPTNNLL